MGGGGALVTNDRNNNPQTIPSFDFQSTTDCEIGKELSMDTRTLTTSDLKLLRFQSRNDELQLDTSDYVSKANEAFQNADRSLFIETCFGLWSFLSQSESRIGIPPQYTGNGIQKLMTRIFSSLFALQTEERLGAGGNVVLNGLKGVGKTTLLQVTGVIAACLTDKVYPLYWTYECDSSRSDLETVSTCRLRSAAISLFDSEECESFEAVIRSTVMDRSNTSHLTDNKRVLFLLDEFTDLYDRGENGINVIREYQSMARAGNVYFVLATSRSNIEKYIFPCHVRSNRMYPTLHCGMFEVYVVEPIRNQTYLREYLELRYRREFTMEETTNIFYVTGGVGRYIDQHIQQGIDPTPATSLMFQTDPQLFHVACYLLMAPIPIASMNKFADLDKFDDWIDRLLFYKGPEHVTFLLPSLQECFRNELQERRSLQEAHIFHLRRKGLKGGHSSNGQSNENFIGRYLPALFGLQSHERSLRLHVVQRSRDFEMMLLEGNVEIIPIPSPTHSPEAISAFLNEHAKRLISWQVDGQETGLDRIWFEWNQETNEMTLHGAQIKIGKDDQMITCGNLQTERSYRMVSQCNDDRCIAGIFSKVEHGLISLIPQLKERFRCSLTMGTIYLCTNMKARQGFVEFFRQEMNDPSSHHHYFKFPSAVSKKYVLPDRFQCKLYDGDDDWLQKVLPDTLINFI